MEAWQLPDLDSRQWEQLGAPIGLAVAVKHITNHQLQRQFAPERDFEKIVLQEEKEQENNDAFAAPVLSERMRRWWGGQCESNEP